MPTKVSYKQFLPKLGVTTLKKEQKQIITAVLNGKDTLYVLPTGFGKSLCYVLLHMLTKRNVVSFSTCIIN